MQDTRLDPINEDYLVLKKAAIAGAARGYTSPRAATAFSIHYFVNHSAMPKGWSATLIDVISLFVRSITLIPSQPPV